MTVTIAVPGKFQTAYHFARHLEQRGLLERLITPIPFGRARDFGVSRSRTRILSPFAYWYHGFERYAPRCIRPTSQLLYSSAFGHAAATLMGEPAAFNGWCTIALEGIRRARRLGIPSVLISGSTHIRWQTDTLREEFARWGYDGPLTDARLVARVETEIAEADAIVVPSQFSLETFRRHGVPDDKLFLVPWAVQPVTSPPDHRPRRAEPRILFVGQVTLRKGLPYLFSAFRKMRSLASLRLVGPVDRRAVEVAGGLPAGAEVVGRRRGDALATEYREADIFVLPSVEEGSALVVSEAMSAGLPVVVSDEAGADHVVDGMNGFMVPGRDAQALAERLDQLAGDRDLRLRLGAAAREAVKVRDCDEYGADLYRSVFERLQVRATS